MNLVPRLSGVASLGRHAAPELLSQSAWLSVVLGAPPGSLFQLVFIDPPRVAHVDDTKVGCWKRLADILP